MEGVCLHPWPGEHLAGGRKERCGARGESAASKEKQVNRISNLKILKSSAYMIVIGRKYFLSSFCQL